MLSILNPAIITAVLESIGILQLVNIGKYLQRKSIFVLIESNSNNNTTIIIIISNNTQVNQLIITKNHGIQHLNQRCPIP